MALLLSFLLAVKLLNFHHFSVFWVLFLPAPFLSSHTALISQNIQSEYNSEALIEKLIISGDVISAETLWKEELDSGGQLSTSYSENTFVSNPINFKTTKGYIVTRLELTGTFSIYFQLKTTKLDGLIMYVGPLTQNRPDFMAVELVAGIVRFVFDVGTGIRVVRSNPKQRISNNEWHDVGILRPTLTQHILRVDDSARSDPLPDDAGNYDLTDEFYVGGLPQDLFDSLPKQVKSRHGFNGCLSSIDLNGESQHLMEDGKASIADGNVMSGCEGECHLHLHCKAIHT